jgi:hypothetical protein
MNVDRSVSPNSDGDDDEEDPVAQPTPSGRPPGGSIHHLMHLDATPRNRSPTPPRALFRSTTGKGVAFTDADITFLVRFMAYRRQATVCSFYTHAIYDPFLRSQGKLDMVQFWKDVAAKVRYTSIFLIDTF